MPASENPPSDASVHALSKWRLIACFWAAQAILFAAAMAIWIVQINSAAPSHPAGKWEWSEFASILGSPEYWAWMPTSVLVLMTLQTLIVWPVRKPRPRKSGWPVWLSLAATSLIGAALTIAIAFAIAAIFQLVPDAAFQVNEKLAWTLVIAGTIVFWIGGWILMHAFCSRTIRRGGRYEQALARISATLFTGTLIEAAAIMPLDILYRRRETCYCAAGTLWAYTLLIPAGLITLGPAIFLPILMHRRKRWYASRCDCCGYDMSGLLHTDRHIDRCPECGAGWRT